MRKLAAFVLGIASASGLAGQGVPELERVLLPVWVGATPGRFGSLWVSELSVYNDNSTYAQIAPLGPADYPGVPPRRSLTLPPPVRLVGGQPGQFILLSANQAAGLHFNLRVREISREAQAWGTEIPVVREGEFRTGSIHLLNVPLGEGFRQVLRIYEALNTGDTPGQVRVHFFPMGGGVPVEDTPLHDEVLTLVPSGPPFEFVPGYAELSDFSLLLPGISTVRIEIEPVTPGVKYWAFVSLTNNETQQLTTITPQLGVRDLEKVSLVAPVSADR